MIGKAIRYYRKEERGMTLKEVADGLGMTHTTISRYERGIREPSQKTLHRLANVLGVSVQQLEERAAELADKQSEKTNRGGEMYSNGNYVTTTPEISSWRNAVVRDESLSERARAILLALPVFLDDTSWVIPITTDQFVRGTHMDVSAVEEHWQEVLQSPYVERLGENEWTLRLTFPN